MWKKTLTGALLTTMMCSVYSAQGTPATVVAENNFACDFEWMEKPSYPFLDLGNLNVELIKDEGNTSLRISTLKESGYLILPIKVSIRYAPRMVMRFKYRVPKIAGNEDLKYIAVNFHEEVRPEDKGKKTPSIYYMMVGSPSPEWTNVEFAIDSLDVVQGKELSEDIIFDKFEIYAKNSDGSSTSKMSLDIDDIEFKIGEDQALISESNPIFFNWRTGMGESTLEYSQDPDFPADQTVKVVTEDNFYTPASAMDKGTWYYRVSDANGHTIKSTEVDIIETAHDFQTIPFTADMMKDRPRPWLQQKMELTPEQLKEKMELFNTYYSWGVPANPMPYVEGGEWPSFISWYGGVHDRVVISTGVRLQTLAEIYYQTGDESLRDKVLDIALKVAAWNPEDGSSHIAGDIGAYHVQRGLDYAYDVLKGKVSDEQLAPIKECIIVRAKQVWDHYNPFPRGTRKEYNNHSWLAVYAMAEGALVVADEYPDSEDMVEYARQLFLGLFLPVQGIQGENGEGITYWSYGGNFLKLYAEMMKNSCGIDLFKHPWLGQTIMFPVYTCIPNAYAVSFANSGKPNHMNYGPFKSAESYIEQLAVASDNPYGVWYANLCEYRGLEAKAPVDIDPSIYYKSIGWGIFNTSIVDGLRNVSVAMRTAPFSSGHQHDDQNGIVINAYGDKLLIDSGYYDYYGSKHFEQYSTQTQAHNTILVDGHTQGTRTNGSQAEMTLFVDTPHFGYMVGEAGNPTVNQGKLERWTRRVFFVKPDFVVTHDIIKAKDEPVKLEYLAHAANPLFSSNIEQYFDITGKNAELYTKFIYPQLDLTVSTGFPVLPVRPRGNNEPLEEGTITKEWHLSAATPKTVSEEDILVASQIRRLPAERTTRAHMVNIAGENCRVVQITDPQTNEKTVLLSNLSTGNISSSNIATDAEAAVVVFDKDNNVVRAFAQNATQLSYNGTVIISSETPATLIYPTTTPTSGEVEGVELFGSNLSGYCQDRGYDKIYYYTGKISVSEDKEYQISFPENSDVNLIVDMKETPKFRDQYLLTLTPGDHFVVISSPEPIKSIDQPTFFKIFPFPHLIF